MMHQSILDSCLRAVARLPEAYGATIWNFVVKEYGEDVSIGTIYAAMDQLEQNGDVISRSIPGGQDRGFRPKRVWTLIGG